MANLGEFGRPIDIESEEAREYLGTEADTFTFHGEEFTIPERVSALPIIRFADDGVKLEDREHDLRRKRVRAHTEEARDRCDEIEADIRMRSQASVYQFLKSMILEEDWPEFERAATRVGASLDELLGVCNAIISAVTGRPTRRSAASSAGPQTTPSGSTAPSSSAGVPAPASSGQVLVFHGRQTSSGDPEKPEAVTGQVVTVGTEAPYDERYTPAARALGISENEAQRREIAANLVPLEDLGSPV